MALSSATGQTSPAINLWTCAALAAALISVAGSLVLSIGMDLKACPLCLYQRTFVMGTAAVLGLGMLAGARAGSVAALLALPLAVGGLAVCGFHEYLEQAGRLECPAGLLGWGTAPQQALAAQALLVGVLLGAVIGTGQHANVWSVVGALAFGALMAWGAIASAPPMQAAPNEPYPQRLDVCRPPYRPG